MKPPRHSVYTLWWFVPIILLTPGRNVADCCAASASFCVRVGSNRTAVQCFCAQQTQTNADANRRFHRVFGFVSECAKHYGFWNKVRISLIGLCLLLFWMNECFEHLKWFSTVSVSWVVGRSVLTFWQLHWRILLCQFCAQFELYNKSLSNMCGFWWVET